MSTHENRPAHKKRFSKGNKGETLVETLCAILIVAMAVLTLTNAVMASSSSNKMAETHYTQLQNEQMDAENSANDNTQSEPKSGTISIDGASFNAKFYGGSSIASYTINTGGS